MKIVEFKAKGRDTTNALDVLDQLRSQIISGQVIAFAAVAIEPDDVTTAWVSCTEPVTRLRMTGAITKLLHNYASDDI